MSGLRPWIAVTALCLLASEAVSCGGGGAPPSHPATPAPAATTSGPGAVALRVRRASFALPSPLQREVAGVLAGRVYLAGGLNTADVSLSDVLRVDTLGGSATVVGSMPNAFHDAAGAAIGGRLFVFAGGTGAGSDAVQSFDPSTGAGRLEGSLPASLSDLSSASTGGVTYLVGGYDNVSPQRSIYSTRDGRHFSMAGALPAGLRYPAVAASGSVVVIAGGQTSAGFTDEVLAFDPATGKVRTVGHLPQPLAHAAAFVLGGRVYVAGGRNAAGDALRGIESIDLDSGRVRPAGRLPSSLADPGVAVQGETAWLFGGWRGAPVTDVLMATLAPA